MEVASIFVGIYGTMMAKEQQKDGVMIVKVTVKKNLLHTNFKSVH